MRRRLVVSLVLIGVLVGALVAAIAPQGHNAEPSNQRAAAAEADDRGCVGG